MSRRDNMIIDNRSIFEASQARLNNEWTQEDEHNANVLEKVKIPLVRNLTLNEYIEALKDDPAFIKTVHDGGDNLEVVEISKAMLQYYARIGKALDDQVREFWEDEKVEEYENGGWP